MNDVFARIGLALEHLMDASTVHGPAKEEVTRLIGELRLMDAGITEVVAEQVQKQADLLAGSVTDLKSQVQEVHEAVFSDEAVLARGGQVISPPEIAQIAPAPAIAATETAPVEPEIVASGAVTEDPAAMTAALATEWLDAHGVEHKGVTKVGDLRILVDGEMKRLAVAGAPA